MEVKEEVGEGSDYFALICTFKCVYDLYKRLQEKLDGIWDIEHI